MQEGAETKQGKVQKTTSQTMSAYGDGKRDPDEMRGADACACVTKKEL